MENTDQKQFSVSLVYTKQTMQNIEIALRVQHLEAVNEHEALGKAIYSFSEEMKDYVLVCRVIMEIKV